MTEEVQLILYITIGSIEISVGMASQMEANEMDGRKYALSMD